MRVVTGPRRPVIVEAPATGDLLATADWLSTRVGDLHDLRREHGAVMLRGTNFRSAEEFGLLRDRLISAPADYVEKATPRSAYGGGVFTATDVPARRRIRLHNENSYALRFPGLLVFGCLKAPHTGGETFLGDMRRMAELLPDEVVERFRTRGWQLVRNYWGHFGLTWQEAFGTTEPAEVDRYATEQGLTTRWHENRLTTTQTRSALIRHPETGDVSWFNHVAFWSEWTLDPDVREYLSGECGPDLPFRTFYGDGEPVEREVVELLNAVQEEVRIAERWQPGDLLLVDNLRLAHGREAFQGEREVLVAMGDPIERVTCEL